MDNVTLFQITVRGVDRTQLLSNFQFEIDLFAGVGNTLPVTIEQNGPVTKHESPAGNYYEATRTYRIGPTPEAD